MTETVLAIIQTLALVVSLVYVALQTEKMSRSIAETRNELRLQVLLSTRDGTQRINDLLLTNERLQRLFGWDDEEILAFELILDSERVYLYRLAGYIDDEFWPAQENLIVNTMSLPWVRKLWETYHERNEYHPQFTAFVNEILSRNQGEATT